MTIPRELLLYMSRSQLVQERIEPALAAGSLVLADRFISSTLAYQGTAGGLPESDICAVGEFALAGRWPDCTVIFDVDESVAASRRDAAPDRMESRASHSMNGFDRVPAAGRVRSGSRAAGGCIEGCRHRVCDAPVVAGIMASIDSVAESVRRDPTDCGGIQDGLDDVHAVVRLPSTLLLQRRSRTMFDDVFDVAEFLRIPVVRPRLQWSTSRRVT